MLRFKFTAWIILPIYLLSIKNNYGQISTTLRQYAISPCDTIIITDSMVIDYRSIKINTIHSNQEIKNYILSNRKIILQSKLQDSIILQYRVVPILQSYSKTMFDTNIQTQYKIPEYALLENNRKKIKNDEWWDSKGLLYSGNFSRGLSVGNTQSLVLNSNLNLQIQGDLGDGLKLTAAISDNQIPIQAEGNTRQLNEFDKLFIQIEKNKTKLIAGDYEISKPDGYFQNYFKKNKGILISNDFNYKKINFNQRASAAISKGKSNRMNLSVLNGNQGPYRLRGKDGENFLIVLSGSEKVWWDGILLERGADGDYVMDYNLAEIRFTTKRIVTESSRIIIEFEYADQNYTRSLFSYNNIMRYKNKEIYINYIHEQDSKKPAIENDLDSLDKKILRESGDDIKLLFRSSAKLVGAEYNKNRIYYRFKDTTILINNISKFFKILVYEAKSDSTAIQANFTDVGSNNGSYILKQSNANGRIYEWISPDPITLTNRGNYEPIVPLIPPNSLSMLSIGTRWLGKNNDYLSLEVSQSNQDLNRISTIDDQNNTAYATRIEIKSKNYQPISTQHQISFLINYEYSDSKFRFMQAYRPAEFSRDWNVNTASIENDNYFHSIIQNSIGKKCHLDIQNDVLKKSNSFLGMRNGISFGYRDTLYDMNSAINILNSQNQIEKTQFIRPSIRLSRQLTRQWNSSVQYNKEKNKRIDINTDTLKQNSFDFDWIEATIQNMTAKKYSLQFIYNYRIEKKPDQYQFHNFSAAHQLTSQVGLKHNTLGNLDIQITGRKYELLGRYQNDSNSTNTILTYLDHQVNLWKNTIKLKNNYQVSSNLEPRLEFIYEELRPGEGDYIYQDYNNDGIRQTQEYVFAPEVDSARYIRIQLFNSEYYHAFHSSWNSFMSIDFNQHVRNKFFKKISYEHLSRFSSKQNQLTTWVARLNPLYFLTDVSKVISYQSLISENLYYNRANPKYEYQWGVQHVESKTLYISGDEFKKNIELLFKSRFTIFKQWDVVLNISQKINDQKTANYALQNFRIKSQNFEPEIIYRHSNNIRFKLGILLKTSKELTTTHEQAKVLQIQGESAIALKSKFSLRSNFRYINIAFDGKQGTPLEYNMLEGYKDGNNYLCDNLVEYKLNQLIQISFGYTARKTADNPISHTGRAVMRALF